MAFPLPADGNLFVERNGVLLCPTEDGQLVAPEPINMDIDLPKTVVNGFITTVNNAIQYHKTLHTYWKDKANALQELNANLQAELHQLRSSK